MEKIVVKTAVKTVLIILGILAVVFAIFNFAFPQHMATATESLGNYDLAVKYASLRYHYTNDCHDLARCFDDSVLLGNDKYILQYGDELVAHRDYEDVCEDRNALYGGGYDYNRRVNSKRAVAMYNTGKGAEGIDLAAQLNGTTSFVMGNPLMSLAALIRTNQDGEGAKLMKDKLERINPAEQKEKDYLTEVKAAMNGLAATVK
ncbi:MAG: hypothetical protein K2O67_06450 [Clostridia bacterium]|nr:hypothetical protein [Clostridia bacterium]